MMLFRWFVLIIKCELSCEHMYLILSLTRNNACVIAGDGRWFYWVSSSKIPSKYWSAEKNWLGWKLPGYFSQMTACRVFCTIDRMSFILPFQLISQLDLDKNHFISAPRCVLIYMWPPLKKPLHALPTNFPSLNLVSTCFFEQFLV